MSSLRARLVAAVLVVAAVGLLLLAAITYAEQRSFQLDRADEQARAGARAVEGALAERGIGDRDEPPRGPLAGGPPRGGGPGVGLPAGTYGQLRDASGKVLGDVVFDYGQNVTANPAIPKQLAVDEPRTVEGRKGDEASYRVVATRGRGDSGTTVVAIPLREVEQRLNRLIVVEGLVIDGAFWSPFGPTVHGGRLDTDLLITRTTTPLRVPAAALLRLVQGRPSGTDSQLNIR